LKSTCSDLQKQLAEVKNCLMDLKDEMERRNESQQENLLQGRKDIEESILNTAKKRASGDLNGTEENRKAKRSKDVKEVFFRFSRICGGRVLLHCPKRQ
jgi:hypothetical protein